MRYSIFEWVDPRTGEGAFTHRYDKLNANGQAKCDARLDYLRGQHPAMWREPHAKKLSWERDDDCKDIYEIRFKAGDLQHRPMGYFGPGDWQFTVVLWVTHKGTQYDPSNFASVAKRRWDNVRSGRETTREVSLD